MWGAFVFVGNVPGRFLTGAVPRVELAAGVEVDVEAVEGGVEGDAGPEVVGAFVEVAEGHCEGEEDEEAVGH